MTSPRFSVTTSLILINLVVFFAGMIARQGAILSIPIVGGESTSIFTIAGSYSWFHTFMQGEWWRVISYQFLHANLGHLIFNMWALFFFGPPIERIFGAKRYLAYYLTCGVAGALFASLIAGGGIIEYGTSTLSQMQAIHELVQEVGYDGPVAYWQLIPMVGASASIYGVLVAAAFLFPDARVSLLFPPVTLTIRWLAIIIMGIATLTILMSGYNAGGEAGHLGGIIMGALIMLVLKKRLQY